jgi:hypothetical protein
VLPISLVIQTPIRRIPFDKGGIRHHLTVKHVTPLEADEFQRRDSIPDEEIGLTLEAAYKG